MSRKIRQVGKKEPGYPRLFLSIRLVNPKIFREMLPKIRGNVKNSIIRRKANNLLSNIATKLFPRLTFFWQSVRANRSYRPIFKKDQARSIRIKNLKPFYVTHHPTTLSPVQKAPNLFWMDAINFKTSACSFLSLKEISPSPNPWQ